MTFPTTAVAARSLSCCGVVLLCAGTALAQPAGVTVTDIGNFAGSASTLQTRSLTLTTAAPVAWFKIRVPRIADPHRYLDVSTSGLGFGDSELALYASTGALIASDDDDGAQTYSALSFGITSPSAAGRTVPFAQPGQTAGEPNNGRDGTLSGDPMVGLLGTAGDYYIAVTRFDATFGNGFGVIPPAGPASDFSMLLTVHMGTPGGQVAPTVNGNDRTSAVGAISINVSASVSSNTTGVSVDLSSFGGPSDRSMSPFVSSTWSTGVVILSPPPSQIGVFPMTFRASNAIGDVAIDVANVTVRPRNALCGNANSSPVATTPGTTIYTYNTTLGDVDGPWTNACFNPAQPPTGNDVWFRFQPTSSGTLTLSTCNADTGATGGQPDTLLGFRGRCDDGGFSVCGDDVGGCGTGTRLSNIPVTAGQEYSIAVRAWGSEIESGRLAVTFTPTTCGPSDIAGPNQSIGADGVLTADDIIVFLGWFFAGDSRANIAGPNQSTVPDTAFTADDIIVFLGRYFGGC